VAELVTLCGYLPLAISLLASLFSAERGETRLGDGRMTQQRSSGGEKSVEGLLVLPELRRPTPLDTLKIANPVCQRSTSCAEHPMTGPPTTLSILKRPCSRMVRGTASEYDSFISTVTCLML
jgi:hypothetical protein